VLGRVRGDRSRGIVVVGRRGRRGRWHDALGPCGIRAGRGRRHVDILFGLHLRVGSLVVQELMLAPGVLIQCDFATKARERSSQTSFDYWGLALIFRSSTSSHIRGHDTYTGARWCGCVGVAPSSKTAVKVSLRLGGNWELSFLDFSLTSEKRFSQPWHWKGFSPVCVRMCTVRALLWMKVLLQSP